jgi:DNA-directed RNA polymerase subunit beta'
MRVADIESLRIKIASPEDIESWSNGEITKAETINYRNRTQRPEKDGLFCEKIFGPVKDYECACGKYKRVRYKGVVCDKCGVEVTKSTVRRERMGHIKLACPCSHIWFLRGVPSRIGLVLDIPLQKLEGVIYFMNYIVTEVNEDEKKKILEEIEKEFKTKSKNQAAESKSKKEAKEKLDGLKKAKDKAKEEVESIKLLKILSEIEYLDFSLKYGQIFEAGTGAEILRKIFENVDLKKIFKDLGKQIEKSSSVIEKTKALRLTHLPVLPPDLRPMVQLGGGRYASSDLNDLYRRVINRNKRLKYLLEIAAPDVIVRNEKRMLQEAVDALIDNTMRRGTTTQASTGGRRLLKSLADILKGKQGRFRQNLLGKRVDYSGRSVIVVGPNLKLNQCGLPKKMALELFKPFVIKGILDRELAYNVKGASRLIEEETDEVWEILEEVVKNKSVLLNRAPTLHRLGFQAFHPVLVEGEAIRIHPLVCKAFNADFDGDQMAVHLPLSHEAQKEARELMLSSLNLLKPATGSPIVTPEKDIVLGCYWITRIKESALGEGKMFSSKNEAILAYDTEVVDLRAKVKVRLASENKDFTETTVGRIMFNRTIPDGYGFVNEMMNSKKLEALTANIIRNYNSETVMNYIDKVKVLGFEYSTLSGVSWGMDDLIVPKEKPELIKKSEKEVEAAEQYYKKGLLSSKEKTSQIIEIWQKTKSEIEKLVPQTLPRLGSVFTIVDSGARGSWSQPVQMSGMKGLVSNPSGEVIELPIKNSYKEGLDVLEYFISTHGARKGTTDTALRTATAGYLTRRLADVSHEMIVGEEDCKDKEGFVAYKKEAEDIGQSFVLKIVGRECLEDIKGIVKQGEIIDWEKADKIVSSEVEKVLVRSPLSCKSKKGICRKCYGWDMGKNSLVGLGEAVGIVAAQSIGEPGTQLTMRTFHTGGVAGGGDITQGLPRVDEILECRPPKGKAEISFVDGVVEDITPDGKILIKTKDQVPSEDKKIKKAKKTEKDGIIEYKIPEGMGIWVEKNNVVKKGQQLCEGSMDLQELFKAIGSEAAKRYIVREIQKIYASQGVTIHDKHIEIIIRQMFSRVKVIDSGDSILLKGEIMEQEKFNEINTKLKEDGKKLAQCKSILLGISKVALSTNSFLSAASFQETSRVLIGASLMGKVDELKGLKENVIIGKLIPAGTGFKKKQ